MRWTVALLIAWSATARADGNLRYDLRWDVPATAAGALAWALPGLAGWQPRNCRWCDDNALDAAARDALRWSDTAAANAASNVGGYVLAPACAFGLTAVAAGADGRLRAWPADGLIVAEATVWAGALDGALKIATARRRPFVHALSPAERAARAPTAEDNVSFYSGHTSFAFSLAVAGGTVASLRGYRYAPLVWAVGLPIAAATGYLRIAADKHYLTDVLAGAVMGSAVGFGVPYFFHRGRADSASAGLFVGGPVVGVAGAW